MSQKHATLNQTCDCSRVDINNARKTFGKKSGKTFLAGTAISAILTLGYGRGSYAQSVTFSGTQTEPQSFLGPGVAQTSEGFSVDASSLSGIIINTGSATEGDTAFIDNYSSSITGAYSGMNVVSDTAGALSITTTGYVTGRTLNGISARIASVLGTDLTISAVNVVGQFGGMSARNNGVGDISITSTGVASAATGIGIYAKGLGQNLFIDAATVSGGGTYGVFARNSGSGELSITTSGDVTGQSGSGISAISYGTDLTINAAAATGGISGMNARSYGTGALSITTSGDVTGQSEDGISAHNDGTDMTVNAAKVTGGRDGINARSYGTGALRITTSGDVTGQSGDGILALNDGTDLTINATTATGGTSGIAAENNGTGSLSITTSGDVTGQTGDGILALNDGTDLTINAATATGVMSGINARNSGTGMLSITASGDLTGGTGDGIFALAYGVGEAGDEDLEGNSLDGVSLAIKANNVTGGTNGVTALNEGRADLSITSSGNITGDGARGVFATNFGGANLTINVADVTGQTDGVFAGNFGTGVLRIDASGTISGAGFAGIFARNSEGNGTDLILDVADVDGAETGIFAENTGTGELSITVDGDVTGSNFSGIFASNNGTDLTVDALNAQGYRYGIYATNSGSGDLSITSTGDLTGMNGLGIRATNEATGEALTISAHNVTGADTGISATNYGSGDLSITAVGDVTGSASYGIAAINHGLGLSITAENNVRGNRTGIAATNWGTGSLSISTTGTVEGNVRDGIKASNLNYGYNLNIQANSVTGETYGISAENGGSGVLQITTNGLVIGRTDDGIAAFNQGTDLRIEAKDVAGARHGIYANNFGSGALSITVSGNVIGGTGEDSEARGIYAVNNNAETLTVTISEGGSVSTSGDFAIRALAVGPVNVLNSGTVKGRVFLTNSNRFTNSGTWDLSGTTSDFNATGDSLVVNEGLVIAAGDAGTVEFSAINDLDEFQSNAGGTIRLADDAAGDSFWIDADVTNLSSITPGVGAGDFVANGGTVELDVVLGGDRPLSDFLAVLGDVTLGSAPTALAFTSVGEGLGGTTDTGIEVVAVGGTSDAGTFVLAGPLEVGAIAYDLSLGDCTDQADQNWYLCNNGTIGTTGAVFEAMPGVILNSFARAETLQHRLASRVTGLRGTISTQGAGDLPVDKAVGPWIRTWGDFADITPDTSAAGTSWEADSWGLDAGIGMMVGNPSGGDLVAGVNLRYSVTSADLSNPVGTGSVNSEGFGIAASLTWFGNDGFYVDANGAVDFVSIDATSQGGGALLDGHDDVVYSASAEIGKRFELNGGTALVPQAQLSWGQIGDRQITDNLGNVISFADRDTLTSRVGLTVEQDVTDTAFGSGKVFCFGNMLNDLSGSRSITVAGTNLTQSGTGDWVEVGAGVSLQPTDGTSLFGQVSYREAFDGVSGEAVAVSAGWKMQW